MPAGRMNTGAGAGVCVAMSMTILFLSPEHELVRGSSDAQSAEFASDPRHPGEEPQVLLLLDDHGSQAARTEIVPADPEVQRWLPRVMHQIRESSLHDAFEAIHEVLVARNTPELTADALVEAARAIVTLPKIPEGWTAWGQIPRGSLSSLGDGRWLIVWPEQDASGRDMACISGEGAEGAVAVTKPERAYRPDRPVWAFVRVARTGLTSAQIAAFLAADHPEKFDPEVTLAAMFPVEAA